MDQFHEQDKDNPAVHRSRLIPTDDELKIRFIAKYGPILLLDWEGHPKTRRSITVQDLKDAVDAEAIIEKLTGLRIHILQVVE